ncbi:hypothetical protein ACTXT7_014436 [Hymenolepis weldensis]
MNVWHGSRRRRGEAEPLLGRGVPFTQPQLHRRNRFFLLDLLFSSKVFVVNSACLNSLLSIPRMLGGVIYFLTPRYSLSYVACRIFQINNPDATRRLSRPSFASLAPLVSEPLTDNYAGAWAKTHLSNRQGLFGQQSENQLELGGPSDLLALSQNFGWFSVACVGE